MKYLLLLLLIIGCTSQVTNMRLTSPAFLDGKHIPARYTCDKDNINPPFVISDIPANTQTLALIVDDPDAPSGIFTHWVVYNIQVKNSIAENENPGVDGKNSAGKTGYFGPCPPSGTHRYFFRIYALDTKLDFKNYPTKKELENAMKNHILAQAVLMGTYSRK